MLLELLSLYASFIYLFIYLFLVLSFVQFEPNLRDKRLKVNGIDSPALGRLSSLGRGGGGRGERGTQRMFIQGGSVPSSNTLSFYIPFFTKKVPLSYTFYWQMVTFNFDL